MNRRQRRFYEREQKKAISKTQQDVIRYLEKQFPTDEDKIAYIKKLQEELESNKKDRVAFVNVVQPTSVDDLIN